MQSTRRIATIASVAAAGFLAAVPAQGAYSRSPPPHRGRQLTEIELWNQEVERKKAARRGGKAAR